MTAPLVGDDGRTHYVTLTQYSNGEVRVRFSLFSFPAGTYNVIIRSSASCGDEGGLVEQLTSTPLVWTEENASGLVLTFYGTRAVSVFAGEHGSIYDGDGAAIAFYRLGSGGDALLAACALLGVPPGPPGTGSGIAARGPGGAVATIAVALMAYSVVVLWWQRREKASATFHQ